MKLFKSKLKQIQLSPEIETKLERMSTDSLLETTIFYKDYNYEIGVKRKAAQILRKRGVEVESATVRENGTAKNADLIYLFICIGLLVSIGVYFYIQFDPSRNLYSIYLLSVGLILIIAYLMKQKLK